MPTLMVSLLGFALCYLAFARLALLQRAHLRAIEPTANAPTRQQTMAGRTLAVLLLAGALTMLLRIEGGGFGSVLWLMLCSAAALAVSLTLAWRPAFLKPLATLCSIGSGQ
ncbi:MAG TPA: DUF3325 domain-containing protein [Pseudomonas xinjiangensis]|uniref:DUF3325 domain-containing protein n=2 Tax=root TaxID=1 RepID=A0A7V1BQD1_9GAMM|nr:DUF3325 domain-containing protein [Halopseudomonas xinjiangensis]HEC46154.1 DUF3325 domain-containing protein [Halopseudomonas xinjiangensis]